MEIKRNELSQLKMVSGGEKRHITVIDKGVVKYWVGFGWVGKAVATEQEREQYPTVID